MLFFITNCLFSSCILFQRHGLKAKKLGFYNLLGTLAFKHCDGVVDIQRPPDGMDGSNAVNIKMLLMLILIFTLTCTPFEHHAHLF